MLFTIRKLPNQRFYKVFNNKTKKVHSYRTTLKNAKKQVRLLYAQLSNKKKGNACWNGYKMIGLKKKGSRNVPNCVPIHGGAVIL